METPFPRTLVPLKTHYWSRTPSKNASENLLQSPSENPPPFSEPFLNFEKFGEPSVLQLFLGKSKGGLTKGGLSPKFSEKIGGKSFLRNRAFSGQIGTFSGPIGAFSGPIGTNSSAPHSHGGRAEIAPKGPFLAHLAPFGPSPPLLSPPLDFPDFLTYEELTQCWGMPEEGAISNCYGPLAHQKVPQSGTPNTNNLKTLTQRKNIIHHTLPDARTTTLNQKPPTPHSHTHTHTHAHANTSGTQIWR